MKSIFDLTDPCPRSTGTAESWIARTRGILQGHLLTTFPALFKYLKQWRAACEREVYASVTDRDLGTIVLSGLYAEVADADTLVVIVHGHGGNAGKPYCHDAAIAARQCGFSSLRISLRGADLFGEDIYHGGLTGDLTAFVSRKEYAHYRKIILFGFSVGGHIVIRAALDRIDPRLAAVIAISPPIDIPAAVRYLDGRTSMYRHYILRGLQRIYASVDLRRRAKLPMGVVRQATTLREMDELTVVPRFGFRSVEDYYSRITLKHRMGGLRAPLLIAGSNHDPVVPASVIRSGLIGAPDSVVVRWVDGGGHLHFPPDTRLGLGIAPPGLARQCMWWASRYATG
jgi:predicted alpha/beta-fold hydrolase